MPTLNCELLPVAALRGTAVVILRGAIDPRSVEILAAELGSAKGKAFHTLVLNLGDVRYINSAGLSFLVNLSDALHLKGGGLLLANPQPKVKVVFDLMGVAQFFRIYKSVDAAVAAVSAARRAASPRPALARGRR
ncbi:MAG TPA: STAS domain-containing protein [Planctomycetota bacterium]|nr:STAS domain-containing protein [Planctomycetota bacterium]